MLTFQFAKALVPATTCTELNTATAQFRRGAADAHLAAQAMAQVPRSPVCGRQLECTWAGRGAGDIPRPRFQTRQPGFWMGRARDYPGGEAADSALATPHGCRHIPDSKHCEAPPCAPNAPAGMAITRRGPGTAVSETCGSNIMHHKCLFVGVV